jgi:hypothetical protein
MGLPMKHVHSAFRTFLFLAVISLHLKCDKSTEPTSPPAYARKIELAAVDSSCTEAWLRITLSNVLLPQTVELRRNNEVVSGFEMITSDSLLIDTALSPRQVYSYKAYRLEYSRAIDSSSLLTLTSLDTTSHEFAFQYFNWPVQNSFNNMFEDATIINDTLAYACGSVYVRDSSGIVDQNRYNLARWNGLRWDLIRILSYAVCGEDSQATYPASSVIAFSPTDVWVAIRRGQVAHWNGTVQTATMCLPQPFVINKIWGQDPTSLYAVGDSGRIAHFSSGTWQRIESGTTLKIWDVYGEKDRHTGVYEVLCAASYGGQKKILKIQGSTVSEVQTEGIDTDIYSLWHIPGRRYLVGGMNRAYTTPNLESAWKQVPGSWQPHLIDGCALNDILFGCWAPDVLWHFNGVTWRVLGYGDPWGWWNDVSLNGNTIIAVGGRLQGAPQNSAVAWVGRRN